MSSKRAMPDTGISVAGLWDDISAGLVAVDRSLKIVAFNRAWSSLCDKYSDKKPAIGMDVSMLLRDEAPVKMLAEALHGKPSRRAAFNFMGDVEKYFDLTAAPVEGGALLMAVDTTEHCRAMRNIESARSEAEFYVDLMSHDIRNFNQVTMGYIELLQLADDLEPSKQAYLEKAQKGVTGSNKLIDNIKKIRMIRQFAGKKLEKMDLNEVLARDAEDVSKASPAARIALKFDKKETHGIMADEYVHELFRHIMENAVKYDTHPEKLIEVAILPVKGEDTADWSVTISDHGGGVSDDKKRSIFERMTKTTKGAGVGLSIVSVIVNKYGGRIYVEDRVKGDPSQGSVFVVEIPQAR